MKRGAFPFKPSVSVPVTRKLSAESKLAWSQFIGPLHMAATALNTAFTQAQDAMARQLLLNEGLDPEEGWQLNMDTLEAVRKPGAASVGRNGKP